MVGLTLLITSTVAAQTEKRLNQILSGYVKNGRVDYQSLRAHGRPELQGFVNSLSQVNPEELDRMERIAFWLDAYNALVVHQIVERNTDVSSARKRSKFFRGRRYNVGGKSLTLDDIEHRALRPLAQDPRVHFVLVCGAQSCPPLRAESFLATDDLDGTLEQATRTYINNPKNVKVDLKNRRLTLNKIFDWYKEDFGNVVDFVSRYRPPGERAALRDGEWEVTYFDYDWTLNQSSSTP